MGKMVHGLMKVECWSNPPCWVVGKNAKNLLVAALTYESLLSLTAEVEEKRSRAKQQMEESLDPLDWHLAESIHAPGE